MFEFLNADNAGIFQFLTDAICHFYCSRFFSSHFIAAVFNFLQKLFLSTFLPEHLSESTLLPKNAP